MGINNLEVKRHEFCMRMCPRYPWIEVDSTECVARYTRGEPACRDCELCHIGPDVRKAVIDTLDDEDYGRNKF